MKFKVLFIMIFILLAARFVAAGEDTIVYEGTVTSHFVFENPDNEYSWEVYTGFNPDVLALNVDYEFIGASNNNNVEIRWKAPGNYFLKVTETNSEGCSNVKVQSIVVQVYDPQLIVDAGENATIGSCMSYQFQSSVSDTSGLTYGWEPAENLDDPSILNPVFTPGSSTTFILTVTSGDGEILKDTVEIAVSEVYANAGDDFIAEEGTTVLLDASQSYGDQLQYFWSTFDGNIVSGRNSSSPEINSSGTYYLEVRDYFGCSAFDTVVVNRLIYAPVARDDYDTTTYEKSVTIPILANDEDPDNELDPSTLNIVQYPLNGSVYIHADMYNVTYTPNDRFLGGDVFEYRICNFSDKCAQSHVYVYVTTAPFFIPEAFTPNGDNINDYFEILGIELYEGNKLMVMNRWGKKVYEAENYGISSTPIFWDGKSNRGGGNDDLPTGTYFYVLDLKNGEPPIAGSVYIDR